MLSGLVSGTSDPAAGYQQGKQSATRSVDEAKTRVWEEFGEATWNKTFRLLEANVPQRLGSMLT